MNPLRSFALLSILAMLLWTAGVAEPKKEIFTGKLVVPAEAGTKKSYMTGNFQILVKGETRIVTGSDLVSEQQMLSFKNKIVTVEAIYVPAKAPEAEYQHPIDPSGGPIDHPAHYRILSIKPVKT
jgi:hypothetical protein